MIRYNKLKCEHPSKDDSLLVYKNINDSIEFKIVHICADTLQTDHNRALVGDSFGFLFHDRIYSKEQVFKEIPQAKVYYLKYCKEEDKNPTVDKNFSVEVLFEILQRRR